MEIGKLPMAIVGITIVVIVCAVVLIPVVQESTTAYDTYTNDGYYYMNIPDAEDEITITFDHTKPRVITVDDVEITMPKKQVTFVASDLTLVRYFYISDTSASIHLYTTYPNGVYADSYNNQDMSIVITNGSITATRSSEGQTPVSRTVTPTSDIYVITTEKAPYIMKNYDVPVKMNGDSKFIACGLTTIATNNSVGLYAYGNINDGVEDIVFFRESATTTYNNAVVDYTVESDHVDLYTLNKFTFDIEQGVITYGATYTAFIVPSEITAERSVHPDATTTQLINVIPILVIIGIVMLAVGTMIYYRR